MNVKNSFIGTGRITKDLEVKVTQTGKHVLNFDIAIDDGTKDNPHTTYIPCEIWEGGADIIAKYFQKGDQIIVGGKLVNRKIIDRGENRYRTNVVVDSWEWGAKKKREEPTEAKKEYTFDDVKDLDEPW